MPRHSYATDPATLRKMYGRAGGLRRAALHGTHDLALAGAEGLLEKYRQELDPDRVLSEAERTARARLARRSFLALVNAKRIAAKQRQAAAAASKTETEAA